MPANKKVTSKKPTKTKSKRVVKKRNSKLPTKIKKILDIDQESSNIVKFEEENFSNFQEISVSSLGGLINISVVDHPLDQYCSPHLLDLSCSKYIERVRPTMDNSKISYCDLPAGKALEKIRIFDFLDLENSEILNGIKSVLRLVSILFKKKFYQIDISPKLPFVGKRNREIAKSHRLYLWQEVSLINLLVFIGDKIIQLFSFIYKIVEHFYLNLMSGFLEKDEVVTFTSKEIPSQSKISYPEYVYKKPEIVNKNKKEFKFRKNFSLSEIKFKGLFENFRVNIALKPLLCFVAMVLFLVIPIRTFFYIQDATATKGKVLGQAEQALSNLGHAQDALTGFNFENAEEYLIAANRDFVSAQNQLNEIKSFLTILAETLPVSNTYRSGKNLLELGERLTRAGESLVSGLNQLSSDSEFSLSSRAKNFQLDINSALFELKLVEENLSKINIDHLPDENRDQFIKLKDNLPLFVESLELSSEMVEFAINFLGENELKRYLVVFQNDNELRATGGFMGSFALVDFKSGDIADIKMPGGGTYDLRAGFSKLLASPEPMQLINPRWEFQDANWWPDFPTSADNIAYFYNKSDGATIDGVIAINSDWLGKLLDVVGSIDMPDYKKTITSANFEVELQKSVEIEYEDKKQPKKILGELAPKLLESIFEIEPSSMLDLVASLKSGLAEKDILIRLFDEDAQKFVAQNNWDGRLKDTEKDYLSVVATNISGGKTDGIVNQEIYHRAKIMDDGSIIDSLLISRNHFGPVDEDFTDVANRSYIRVYVPLGSELLSVNGFEYPDEKEFKEAGDYLEEDPRLLNERMAFIDTETKTKTYIENSKTVFGNWVTVQPGESKDVLLEYKLPFKLNFNEREQPQGILGKIKATFTSQEIYDSYSLLIQKQPGSNSDKIISKVEYPNTFNSQVVYPKEVSSFDGESVYNSVLAEDLFYFVGLKLKDN